MKGVQVAPAPTEDSFGAMPDPRKEEKAPLLVQPEEEAERRGSSRVPPSSAVSKKMNARTQAPMSAMRPSPASGYSRSAGGAAGMRRGVGGKMMHNHRGGNTGHHRMQQFRNSLNMKGEQQAAYDMDHQRKKQMSAQWQSKQEQDMRDPSHIQGQANSALTKRVLAGEELDTANDNYRFLVVDPRKSRHRVWDVTTLILLTLTATITPYEVSFLGETTGMGLFVLNRVIDGLFFCDLILNFFLAFFDEGVGMWVLDITIIQKKYIKGWFWVDFISILPFEFMGQLSNSSSLSQLKVLRVIRLLRLAKLLRILRAGRIFSRLESLMEIDYVLLEMTKFCLFTLVLSHWIACIFGMIVYINEKENWMVRYLCSEEEAADDPSHCLGQVAAFEKYSAAIYWGVTTLTTIGYGDIVATTSLERILVLLVMFLGAFQYGYIIGALGSLLSARDERRNRYVNIMMELNSFMDEGHFPGHLRQKLREYFKYLSKGPDVTSYHNILFKLSPKMQGEVAMHVDNNWIKNIDLFNNCSDKFIIEVAMQLTQSTFPPHEVMFSPGEIADSMWIIKKGYVMIGTKLFGKWQTIMSECLYKEVEHDSRGYTITYTDVWQIHRRTMSQILENYPEVHQNFRLNAIRKIFRSEVLAYARAMYALPAYITRLKREREEAGEVWVMEKDTKQHAPINMLNALIYANMGPRSHFYFNKLKVLAQFDANEKKKLMSAVKRIQFRWRALRAFTPNDDRRLSTVTDVDDTSTPPQRHCQESPLPGMPLDTARLPPLEDTGHRRPLGSSQAQLADATVAEERARLAAQETVQKVEANLMTQIQEMRQEQKSQAESLQALQVDMHNITAELSQITRSIIGLHMSLSSYQQDAQLSEYNNNIQVSDLGQLGIS